MAGAAPAASLRRAQVFWLGLAAAYARRHAEHFASP